MTNYFDVWNSINLESVNSTGLTQVARRLSAGEHVLFIASDVAKGLRILYLEVKSEYEVNINLLPKVRGLEISTIKGTVGSYQDKLFLKVVQSLPGAEDNAEIILSDLAQRLNDLKDRRFIQKQIIDFLDDWRFFFQNSDEEPLSLERQKGLFGELHFLDAYLLSRYEPVEAIDFWRGCLGAPQDFVVRNVAVEVKCTTLKEYQKVAIASERQLDVSGWTALYLTVFSLDESYGCDNGTSLAELDLKIRDKLKESSRATFLYNVKLIKSGFREKHATRYSFSCKVIDEKVYDVRDGFPCIVARTLKSGIGDIKYSIMLSACSEFEVNQAILNQI